MLLCGISLKKNIYILKKNIPYILYILWSIKLLFYSRVHCKKCCDWVRLVFIVRIFRRSGGLFVFTKFCLWNRLSVWMWHLEGWVYHVTALAIYRYGRLIQVKNGWEFLSWQVLQSIISLKACFSLLHQVLHTQTIFILIRAFVCGCSFSSVLCIFIIIIRE